MSPSPTAVDRALTAVLAGDATLTALVPDGVYFHAARPNSLRYVWILPIERERVSGLPPTPVLFERYVYLVRAVATATDGATAEAAADRIHALLFDQPLTVTGYTWMSTLGPTPHNDAQVDPIDTGNLRFQERGGVYEICVSPD